MKLYVITISEVNDYEEDIHAPEVKISLEEAKARLEEIYRQAKEELDEDRFDKEEKGEKSFSLYSGYGWSQYHYDACIDEVEADLTAPASTVREQMEAHRLELIANMKAAISALVDKQAPEADKVCFEGKKVEMKTSCDIEDSDILFQFELKEARRDGSLLVAYPDDEDTDRLFDVSSIDREFEVELDLLSLDELYNVAKALEL